MHVELITVGPGDELFTRAGHAALCVDGQCWNYGITDFTNPVLVSWRYLRGQADFWVLVRPEPEFLADQIAQDRAVWRQELALDDASAARLMALLTDDALPEHAHYRYHHFHDNCTSRIRDRIESATGRLKPASEAIYGPTWRDLARTALAGEPAYLAAVELAGRPMDVHPTVWEAMAVPDVLRAEVHTRLGAEPVQIARRSAADGTFTRGGEVLLIGAGATLAGVTRAGVAHRSLDKPGRIAAAVILGVGACALWGAAAVSPVGEARENLALAVFWPTDFVLGSSDPRVQTYLVVRAVGLGLCALASATGLVDQPLAVPASAVILVLLARAFADPSLASPRRPVV
jgi:hypothetical protein